MAHGMSRRIFISAGVLSTLALLSGCVGGQSGTSGSATQAASSSATTEGAQSLVVGTLATEDLLPLWVAQEEGLVDEAGFTLEIVPFQSATELIAGVASGEVDLAMTDIMVTASMVASGIDVRMRWVTLGATPDQGRFGIMAGPESSYTSLADLAGIPIGVGSNTILEYVMDKLMAEAGVPQDQIVVEELQKLPVRFQAMLEGEVPAAALPGSLLALGEAQGCVLIADDTQGENLSQSVMIVRAEVADDPARAATIDALEALWNTAVDTVNANPETYRETLIAHANLSDAIAQTYPICTYPAAALPSADMVEPVLAWMEEKGYLSAPLAYDAATGTFTRK